MHKNTNGGFQCLNFATSKNLVVRSTFFLRIDIFKHTWISPDIKTKNHDIKPAYLM